MSKDIIRLQCIEINNFKNVEHGVVEFNSYKKKQYFNNKFDIIGIYGQNGSGKTSVIEALKILQTLMSGEKLLDNFIDYVRKNTNICSAKFLFYVDNGTKYLVEYSFSIKLTENIIEIISEKITSKSLETDNQRVKTIISYKDNNIKIPIEPKVRYDELIKENDENQIDIIVAKKMCKKDNLSLIFYDDIINMFDNNIHIEHYKLLKSLKLYSILNLFVIETKHSATIPLNFMPVSFRIAGNHDVKKGNIGINLLGKATLEDKSFRVISEVIEQMNIVLKKIIPNLTLEIANYGKEADENNEILTQFELFSYRNGVRIALKNESEGIKKIISILSTLISAYNNPSIFIAVDELDSGIFEFLLGELLNVIEKNGKGQMIFTSHNLRPLEKLNSDNIVVSTTNSKKKFIKIPTIKETNNLRRIYLKSIDLGGLSEPIYQDTNSYEIAHAFRKAGKFIE